MNVRYECAISGVEEEASVEASAPLGASPAGSRSRSSVRC